MGWDLAGCGVEGGFSRRGDGCRPADIPVLAPIAFPEFTAKLISGVGVLTGQYEVFNGNHATLSLHAVVPQGDYEVYVNGVARGSFRAKTMFYDDWGATEWRAGELLFSTEASDQQAGAKPLDFEAAGAAIEIRQGGRVLFTATVPTPFL